MHRSAAAAAATRVLARSRAPGKLAAPLDEELRRVVDAAYPMQNTPPLARPPCGSRANTYEPSLLVARPPAMGHAPPDLVAAVAVARRDGAGCMTCKCWEVRGAARPFWWAKLIAWTRSPREGCFGVGGRLHVYLKLLYRVSAYKIGAKYWYQISVPSTCAEHRDLPIYYLLVS